MSKKWKTPLSPGVVIDRLRDAHKQDLRDDPVVPDAERLGPTPQRLARARLLGVAREIEVGDRRAMFRAFQIDDTPLARLRFRKKPLISDVQYLAGEKYYQVVRMAGLMPSGVAALSRDIVDGGAPEDLADTRVAAKEKYNAIRKGMDFNQWDIVDSIVVRGIGFAEYAERFRRIISHGHEREVKTRPARQQIAQDRLCNGLDWLVDAFGLARACRVRSYRSEEIAHRPDLHQKAP